MVEMTGDPPTPIRRRWRWLAAIAVLLCVVVGWLFKSEPSPRIVFVLSNDERIGFRAAGLGGLDYCDQSPAYRWCYGKLAQYLPVSVSTRIPAPRVTKVWDVVSNTGAKSLVLFFERMTKTSATSPARRFAELVKLEFEDSNGHRYPGKAAKGVPYPDGRDILCFDAFPRRDRALIVHVTDAADATKAYRFEIENPGYRDGFPEWSPQVLPQTKSDSTMDVTLREPDWDAVAQGKALPVDVAVHDTAWERRLVTSRLVDATGNYGNTLSPFETAWKARVTVVRTDAAVLAPTEKWTLGPFPLPAAGSKLAINQSIAINGVQFTVPSLESGKTFTGRGQQPSPARPVESQNEVATLDRTFRVDMTGPESGFYLIWRVEDQAGQPLTEMGQSIPTNPTAKLGRGVRFKPKSDTTQVTLALAVSMPKEFEFLIAPPAPTAGGK